MGRDPARVDGQPAATHPWRLFPELSQKRLRSNQEETPPISKEVPTECREVRSIGWSMPHTSPVLLFEDPYLAAEHHSFNVFVGFGPTDGLDEAENPTQAEEGQ